jgi:hypothetical protein
MDAAVITFDLTSSDPLGVNSVTSSTIPLTFDPTLWLCRLPPSCSMDDEDEAPPTSPPLKPPPFVAVNDAPSSPPPSALADIRRVCKFERITELVMTFGESFIMFKMAGASPLSEDAIMLPSKLGTWLDGGRLLSLGARDVGES